MMTEELQGEASPEEGCSPGEGCSERSGTSGNHENWVSGGACRLG